MSPGFKPRPSRAPWPTLIIAVACFLGLLGGVALGQDLESDLERKEGRLGKVRERQGVLTSELERMGAEISRLEGEVADLRSQEAAVEAELAAKEVQLLAAGAELERDREHLGVVRAHLRRALIALRERLVAIYEAGTPDLLAVVLSSRDYSEIASQTEYLNRIEEADEALVARVSDLRDQAKKAVRDQRELRDRIALARDAIAQHEGELESTRTNLDAQKNELLAARGARSETLATLEERESVLEGDVSELQAEIEAQLGALPSSSYPSGPTAPPGAFAWPVDGVLTSNFGYRWGRQHEGIDVGAAEGTPIWAAADGTVVLQQGEYESGGYGNFTCLDHGGGVTTCYAHQSAFNVSPGARVSQGDVIGLVGNTGNSFGAHLHFEVRVDGVAQDPLGYL